MVDDPGGDDEDASATAVEGRRSRATPLPRDVESAAVDALTASSGPLPKATEDTGSQRLMSRSRMSFSMIENRVQLASTGYELQDTIGKAAPYVRRILVVGPTPTLPDDPRKCRALGSDCALERAAFDDSVMGAWSAIGAINHPKVAVVDPAAWLCDRDACRAFRDGKPLYDDSFHVSPAAAATFGQQVAAGWN